MHCIHGYIVLVLALSLSAVDAFAGAGRVVSYMRPIERDSQFSVRSFWNRVILSKGDDHAINSAAEYTNLVFEEAEELEFPEADAYHHHRHGRVAVFADDVNVLDDETTQWVRETTVSDLSFVGYRSSLDILQDQSRAEKEISTPRRLGQLLFGTLQRFLVFAAFAQVMHGTIIYTGGCRGNYFNGCLGHVISEQIIQFLLTYLILGHVEGGVLWCSGLITFARFLGSFSEFGWAWNCAPSSQHISAEFVESSAVFVYGITNTWMERFGAHPGDPYTGKQIEHISIAVMFWFVGLVGMGLESRRLRHWLAASATASLNASHRNGDSVAEPASYAGSFNPFPALAIGVTGAMMSAHLQKYLFLVSAPLHVAVVFSNSQGQVQMHALWGFCLAGFAVLRCLTYFFVWLSPPCSILPSRPPSEALASFFLACGGLTLIFSDEEITLAAIRRGYDGIPGSPSFLHGN
jgi:hypothetical protein